MENKEQDFINRYKNVQESIVKAMDMMKTMIKLMG